jgi:hypothetical protein
MNIHIIGNKLYIDCKDFAALLDLSPTRLNQLCGLDKDEFGHNMANEKLFTTSSRYPRQFRSLKFDGKRYIAASELWNYPFRMPIGVCHIKLTTALLQANYLNVYMEYCGECTNGTQYVEHVKE